MVATHGLFGALYTDRASHFTHTPTVGQAKAQTQAERALHQLGIELILAHSPQARGRKERLYGTLQGRWPQELRLRGIRTRETANAWLTEHGIAAFNRRFRVAPAQAGTAFVPTTADLRRVFSVQYERTVTNDNTVQVGRRWFQIGPDGVAVPLCEMSVTVHEHLDATWSITYGPHIIGRYDAEGQPLPTSSAPAA